ncbi:MAG: alpha/beta hydrolase [Marinobacter sp.]|uniref:alpha/beta hydrolase n=1 Tax=Marinobacter sp. TaxID=50741 RepID=UPI00299DC0F5|nr:alpha/beta hydrolase [Marinobacter sp.]MDX1756523.1 alpha/beta hydrolase [Marinobacter sp.]
MLQTVLTTGLRQTLQRLVKPLLNPAIPVPLQRSLIRQVYRSSIPPLGSRFSKIQLANVPVLRTRYGKESRHAILYLHGGAYVIGSPETHKGITGHLVKTAQSTVYAPDYRLAPEHPFPAALDDAVTVYKALLDRGHAPENIAVAGDSAGGGLALALAMRLRDEGVALPGSLTLFSPWVDLTHAALYAPESEPVLQRRWIENAAGLYCAGELRTHPYISPIHGDLHGLPPILIQVGSDEILLNDSQRLADKARQQETEVTLEVYNSLWHVFQVHAGQLSRATEAMTTAGDHIRSNQTL